MGKTRGVGRRKEELSSSGTPRRYQGRDTVSSFEESSPIRFIRIPNGTKEGRKTQVTRKSDCAIKKNIVDNSSENKKESLKRFIKD